MPKIKKKIKGSAKVLQSSLKKDKKKDKKKVVKKKVAKKKVAKKKATKKRSSSRTSRQSSEPENQLSNGQKDFEKVYLSPEEFNDLIMEIYTAGEKGEVSEKHILHTLCALISGLDWDEQVDYGFSMNKIPMVKENWKKVQSFRDTIGPVKFRDFSCEHQDGDYIRRFLQLYY